MADLFSYRGTFEPLVLPFSISACTSSTPVPHAPSTALGMLDEILDVLDDKFVHILVMLKSLKKNYIALILAFWRVIYALLRQKRVLFNWGNDGDYN